MSECSFTKCKNEAKHKIRLVGKLDYNYCDLHFAEIEMEGLLYDVDQEQKNIMREKYYKIKYGSR